MDLLQSAARVDHDFTGRQSEMQGRVVAEWARLGEFLVMAYNNGYQNFPKIATQNGYPEAWLRAIGFRETLKPLYVEPKRHEKQEEQGEQEEEPDRFASLASMQ